MQLRSVVDGLVNHTGAASPRERLATIVDELNDMDEDSAGMPQEEIRRRLGAFLVP